MVSYIHWRPTFWFFIYIYSFFKNKYRYRRTIANCNINVISAPYNDHWGAGKVISISRTIHIKRYCIVVLNKLIHTCTLSQMLNLFPLFYFNFESLETFFFQCLVFHKISFDWTFIHKCEEFFKSWEKI